MPWTDTIVDLFHSNDADLAAFQAGGGEAVILKASQGIGFTDPKFAARSKEAAQLGLLVGAYHFADGSSPQKQVDHFLAVAKDIPVLAIDVEPNPKGSTVTVAQAAEMASLVERATGRKPLIYIGRYGPDGEGGGLPNATLAACPLWLSEYQATTPRFPPGWVACVLWQWTDTGSFPGVEGDCDRNRFFGASDELKAFWKASAPMTAAPDVLTVLRASGLPVEAQAFLAAIAEGEGGTNFRVLFSGGTLIEDNPNVVTTQGVRSWTGGLGEFPNWSGAILENGLISTAAGFNQDTKTTWLTEIVKLPGAKTDFSPETQVANNWLFAVSRFKSRSGGRDLLQTLRDGNTTDVHMYLSRTWIGGADAGIAKRYSANLAVLNKPSASEITVTLQAPLKLSGIDQSGKAVSVVIRLASAALLAICIPLALASHRPVSDTMLASEIRGFTADLEQPAVVVKVPPASPAARPEQQPVAISVETSPPSVVEPAMPAPNSLFADFAIRLWYETTCFGPGLRVIRDIEECRAWTPAR